jgi:hypothetical protein
VMRHSLVELEASHLCSSQQRSLVSASAIIGDYR